ncbi:YkvA family protein [Chondromyces crocatus]|uniref:DUF1232 domain-containing protein n=1 Tax=Chondromyces crocatus TaxID=52 RepID=A0A0K1EAG3_CHOCO|nr:YkvA family protein [Chondromyces crocatus]AKT37876.1 uncharacterized protein CMC5_020190 [Chondromyces crocatus]
MTEFQTRCLDTFPDWLRTLASDALELGELLSSAEVAEPARRHVAGSLNYLFKSLDLIPDGIEDLGFLDDAFVLRVAASLSLEASPEAGQRAAVLSRLSGDTKLIAELLGKDYPRLVNYVKSLGRSAARGRTVDEILSDETIRSSFLHEVHGWSLSYAAPSFGRDEKNLIKLTAFLSAKLPS